MPEPKVLELLLVLLSKKTRAVVFLEVLGNSRKDLNSLKSVLITTLNLLRFRDRNTWLCLTTLLPSLFPMVRLKKVFPLRPLP
jgi:hypothetical protein